MAYFKAAIKSLSRKVPLKYRSSGLEACLGYNLQPFSLCGKLRESTFCGTTLVLEVHVSRNAFIRKTEKGREHMTESQLVGPTVIPPISRILG